MSILDKIRMNKNRFMTTMILIVISATAINYGLYSLLDTYFNSVYEGVQLNIILTVLVIGIVTVVMFVLMPKEAVNDLFYQLDNGSKTNEQILQDFISDDTEEEEKID